MGTLSLQLAIYSLVGLPFYGFLVYSPWLVLAGWWIFRWWQKRQPGWSLQQWRWVTCNYLSAKWQALLALSMLEKLLLGFILSAFVLLFIAEVTAPLNSFDGTAMWVMKARHFYTINSVNEQIFDLPLHQDYPVAYPLLFVAFFATGIGFEDQVVQGILILFVLSAATLLYGYVRRTLPHWVALCLPVLLFFNSGSFSLVYSDGYGAYADFPVGVTFLFFGVCIVLWWEEQRPGYLTMAVLALTLGAAIKNEGLSFLILGFGVIGFSLLLHRRQLAGVINLRSLWVALVLAVLVVGGWQLFCKLNHYESDLAGSFTLDRLLKMWPLRIDEILRLLGSVYGTNSTYTALALLLLLALSAVVFMPGRSSLLILLLSGVLIIQAATYFLIYVVTTYDLGWHIGTTWLRLTGQLVPLLILVLSLALNQFYNLIQRYANRTLESV
jgi:hypothetical protein